MAEVARLARRVDDEASPACWPTRRRSPARPVSASRRYRAAGLRHRPRGRQPVLAADGLHSRRPTDADQYQLRRFGTRPDRCAAAGGLSAGIEQHRMYDMQEEERIVRALLARRPEALVLAETMHTRATTQLLMGAGTDRGRSCSWARVSDRGRSCSWARVSRSWRSGSARTGRSTTRSASPTWRSAGPRPGI